MTQWQVFAVLVIGVPVLLLILASVLPCEGCRLRRERIARALTKMRHKESGKS
jgi:hypothetical protein